MTNIADFYTQGVAPGRYALELCRMGRQVVLCDFAPGNIAFAREQFASEPAQVVDIRALPYPDGHFPVVLCLGGPLSHLPSEMWEALEATWDMTTPRRSIPG